ncbi:YetF domain-containing protein [Chitinophaga sp.]|uniref:DUF421 domain-containing protein n=1 Tax=Chitinophaga sp. TaxID=1869181 RepID=UPI0031D4FF97
MQPQDIHWTDLQRILFGTSPAGYYLEIILRVAFVYLLLVCCMRLMGKRMASHLTRNELIALASLAAAVGLPILSFDKGLIPAIVVAFIVVSGQRIISALSCQFPRFERATQGNMDYLLKDGVLKLDKLSRTRVSEERLFSMLRENGIIHLGELKRIYFEANGTFNLVKETEVKLGLCILPVTDEAFRNELDFNRGKLVCGRCGHEHVPAYVQCTQCNSVDFVHPVNP